MESWRHDMGVHRRVLEQRRHLVGRERLSSIALEVHPWRRARGEDQSEDQSEQHAASPSGKRTVTAAHPRG
ncbi:hypothetical protein ASE27_13125 [Oerskovia sp. Root918]|nr:hypothetical protein ASE27_13125 [Oerskovia sp. Root918]